jgi:methanogenic corrinoid protein MtbC1
MQSAMPIIEEAIMARGIKRESPGAVVIGTVSGDIHTIGKSIVASLLTAAGFEVYDLGIDVPVEKFIAAIRDYRPDILAMSALLTTTAPEAGKVIDALEGEGLRDGLKVMVGGGAMTERLAKDIGADGYAPVAPGAVTLAASWLGGRI